MAGWADLPFDLVYSIAQRLHSSYATHIRFQAVCKSWRRCLNNNRRPRPQIPWLMLPYKQESTLRRFYCPVDKKHYHLDLPAGKEAEPTISKGSFGGWSLNIEESSRLQLLNPLSNRLIHLPPLTTFPNVIHHDPNRLHEEYYIVHEHNRTLNYHDKFLIQWAYIHRLCASSSTTKTTSTTAADPCVFMAIYGQCERLAFCRIGDENWSPVSTVEEHSFFQDVVYHDGKFYAGRQLMVLECDIHSLQRPQRIPVESPYHRTPTDISFYLAASSDEGLMMIVRYYKCKGTSVEGYGRVCSYRTTKFEIFRLVLVKTDDGCGSKFVCRKVNSLGDRALFLGTNSPILVPVTDGTVEGIRGNHIYYTDDNYQHQRRGYFGGFDVGVFRLEDQSVHELEGYGGDPLAVWSPPTWVLPNPC